MRTIEFSELEAIRTELDEEFVTTQLVEISAALQAAGPVVKKRRLAGWRRWMASVMVGAGALVPAAAVASESAVPGDVLYSVKRALEPLVELIDHDVVAEHRIEELEALEVDIRDEVLFDALLVEATDAMTQTDAPHLSDRLDAIVVRHRDDTDHHPTDRVDQESDAQTRDQAEDQTTDQLDDPLIDPAPNDETDQPHEPIEDEPTDRPAEETDVSPTSNTDAPRDEPQDEPTTTAPHDDTDTSGEGDSTGGEDEPTDATTTTEGEVDRSVDRP